MTMTNIAYNNRRALPRFPLSPPSLSLYLLSADWTQDTDTDTDTDTTTGHMAITVRAAYDAASLVVPLLCPALPSSPPSTDNRLIGHIRNCAHCGVWVSLSVPH